MTHFMGTHHNKRDAKGRVSIPSSFRGVLKRSDTDAAGVLVLWPSHLYACVEALPLPVFEMVANPLQRLDLFSETQDDIANLLFGKAAAVEPDKEGRVVLPDDLVAHADLAGGVTFIGLGRGFQIWNPEAAEQRHQQARERARERGFTLPAPMPSPGARP